MKKVITNARFKFLEPQYANFYWHTIMDLSAQGIGGSDR
jgi:hypothetical protein